MAKKTIGVFGGTFDPIHFGHLRCALEIKEAFKFDELRLIPCKHPPHKEAPKASDIHRLNMTRLGASDTELIVDEQEMKREGPSYSIDTLMNLRSEFPSASISMIVGIDAFLSLPSWYQWEKLIQMANIIATYHNGFLPPNTGIMADLMREHALPNNKKIQSFLCGKIKMQPITFLEISASKIRHLIQNEQSPRFLLPETVWQYIQKNQLYHYNDEKKVLKQKKEVNS